MTPDSVIGALGGTSEVAKALRLDPPVVSNWRSRGKIPADMWSEIVSLAAARGKSGITLQTLATMHARAAPESEAAE